MLTEIRQKHCFYVTFILFAQGVSAGMFGGGILYFDYTSIIDIINNIAMNILQIPRMRDASLLK
jgi:hypothetical protein